jgi:hypothetical protein
MSTDNLHFLSLLARSEYEVGVIEEAVHNIGLVFHAVVRHFPLAVFAYHEQHGRFAVFKLGRHLNVRLCAVVEHTDRPDVLIAAADRVIEIDLFDSDHRGRHFRRVFLLLRQRLLLCQLLLPLAGIVFRVREGNAGDVVFWF